MTQTALVVFDWDGTLVDSTARIVDCLHQAALATGLPVLAADAYRHIIGLGLPEAIAALYPEADDGQRQRMRAAYSRCYTEAEATPNQPYAGVPELLDALRMRGVLLAVATGKSRPGLDRAFRNTGLGHFFHDSRTADETASKPDPRMLQELLQAARLPPAAVLMVGDTTFDLDMAARAAVPAVGITHGAHPAGRLAQSAPLALVDDIPQLAALVLPRLRPHDSRPAETAGTRP